MINALITGATRGIGRAIALSFAKKGFNVAICSRSADELAATKAALLSVNPAIKVVARVTDIAIKEEVRAFAAQAESELGGIRIIVNNAGVYVPSSILADEENALNTAIAINLMPAYELYRYFGKSMINRREGHIFNICSSASKNVVVEAGTYSVTKFALLGLNNVMKLETQAYGVKVTAVIPGSTLTSSWSGTTIPAERFILPEDIASAIVNTFQMSGGANVDELIINPAFGSV